MTNCTYPRCPRPIKKNGFFCSAHYERRRTGKDMDAPIRSRFPDGTPAYDKVMFCAVWEGDCFVFKKSPLPTGYGRIGVPFSDKMMLASRVVAEHEFGPSELDVLHSCDNPPCVLIDHLRYGTMAENIADAISRGRIKGTSLSDADVIAIRADTRTHRVIAAEYGINQSHVSKIKAGKARRSV